MAKSNDKVHEYRMSGAAWLLEIVKREGIEEAEKELAKRRACFVPLEIPTSKMREFEQKVKWNTIDTVVLLSCATLHDEFVLVMIGYADSLNVLCLKLLALPTKM